MRRSAFSAPNYLSDKIQNWLQELRDHVSAAILTVRLARSNWGLMVSFICLAIVNAITDSFSIMLIVPLLESFSDNVVFSGVPFLENIGLAFSDMTPAARLRWVAAIVLLIIVVKGIAQYALDIIVYIVPLRIERNLRIRAFELLMQSKITFAEGLSSGEVGNYTASFPARTGIAARFLMQVASSFVTIIMILSILIAITPVALISLAGFAVMASMIFRLVTSRLSRRLDTELTQSQESFTQAYFEAVNNKRTIRLFNATPIFLARITGLLERLRNVQASTIAVQNATYPFFSVLAGLLVCVTVLIASFYEPSSAEALLGVMLIFLVAATRLLGPFSLLHIANMHFGIHSTAAVSLDKFFTDAMDNRERDGTIALNSDHPKLVFDKVSFSYPNTENGVSYVSFEARPGEFVAIVGPSGSGKSTLLHLITKLYRPTSGTIALDDVSLDDVVSRSWWDKVSIVSQDIPIFNATVRENIHFGVEQDVDDRRIAEALKLAAADDFVAAMPLGLESRLGEFGSTMSGGEKQRLALARAFYHSRPVILLDEVTSQLDPITEGVISDSIAKLHAAGHTVIAIAHRLSTIRRADRVLVMQSGSLVASGPLVQLLDENEFVKSMAKNSIGPDTE